MTDDRAALAAPVPTPSFLAVRTDVERILKADFDPAARASISGQLTLLVADMLRHGRERREPIREIFSRLGDKWSVLLLMLLGIGVFRHATLRRLVSATSAEGAISQRMLTLRLRVLERDGLISRAITENVPPRVDYAITPLGRGLLAEIERTMAWCKTHGPAIRASQQAFDAREPGWHDSGE